MTREIAQYRYCVNGLDDTISKAQLIGTEASPLCNKSIIQLGIMGHEGLRFFLNDDDTNGIIMGQTGIYELNVDGMTIITSVTFDSNTLLGQGEPIIIDIVYEAEEGIV